MKQKEKEVVVRGMKHSEELGCAIAAHWDVKALGEVASYFNGLSGKTKENFGFGSKFITYKMVFDHHIINLEKCSLVDVKINEKQNTVQYGDLFLTTSSETLKEVGISSILLNSLQEYVYLNSFCFGIRFYNFNDTFPQYIGYLFRGELIRKQLIFLGQGSTRYNLSKIKVMKMPIPLPPVEEQEAIARVLGSADAVLDALAEQHAKAEALKTMLMQQLLSGTRSALDGAPMPMKHSEELGCAIAAHWDVKALGDVADITTGKTPPTENKNNFGNYLPFISPSDLDNVKYIKNSLRKLSIEGSQYIKILPANTVLFTGIGTIGKTGITVNNVATNQQIHALQSIDIEYEYLYYILIFISPVIQLFAQKTAVPQINKTTFSKMPIPLPPVEEQEAIARVLGSADAVIDALAEQRATAEALKTMLMQQLLSGTRSALP